MASFSFQQTGASKRPVELAAEPIAGQKYKADAVTTTNEAFSPAASKRWSRVRNARREEMKLGRRVIGSLKDNAAISSAIARSRYSTLHVAVLRATSHEEAPPQEKHVNAILSAGSSSRRRVSYCVGELMKRLGKTHNWAVALKSLMVVHRALREGTFMFQDQLSVCPSRGGRNYLNLSNFRDDSSPETWQLSSWVRRYASFLDQWLSTCRVLGAFLEGGSAARSADMASGAANEQLLSEISALGELLEAACECGTSAPGTPVGENPVVAEALRMVLTDSCRLQEEILVRLEEVADRMFGLHPSEAAGFLQAAEVLGRREDAYREFIGDPLQLRFLAGSECADVTAALERRLAGLKESLRAVAALKPPVSWTGPVSRSSGRLTQSARFAWAGSGIESSSVPENYRIHRRMASLI